MGGFIAEQRIYIRYWVVIVVANNFLLPIDPVEDTEIGPITPICCKSLLMVIMLNDRNPFQGTYIWKSIQQGLAEANEFCWAMTIRHVKKAA